MTSSEVMIEFAKLHVKAALKAASENSVVDYFEEHYEDGFTCIHSVDKESILKSYPLTNIK